MMTTAGTQPFSVRSKCVLQRVGAAFGKSHAHRCTFWHHAVLTDITNPPCSE